MRRIALVTAALAAAVAAGCGGGDEESGGEANAGIRMAGGGGALRYAVPALPRDLDPLAARTRSAQLVSRQVHEPLVGTLRAPYGGERGPQGLAASVTPSRTRAEWTIALRPGLRFQDGTPLDVEATLANARRWIASPAGPRLLPGAFAVDSPRPGTVRLLFAGRAAGVRGLLASPRLGVVSPSALEPAGGGRSRVSPGATGSGTGPFEFGARDAESIQLARNLEWWGSPIGFGPALDSVTFTAAPAAGRVALLAAGGAEVAEAPGVRGLRELSGDPLLRTAGGPGGVAFSASVRGLAVPPAIPALSGVWLTEIRG